MKIKTECYACRGTGIYHGFAESGNCGVVCNRCKGTGCEVIQYTPFKARKERKDVEWVYEHNVGICIGGDSTHDYKEFGGMSYKEWLDGKTFEGREDRLHTCPAWHNQGQDAAERMKDGYCTDKGMPFCGSFSQCPNIKNKAECWKVHDKLKEEL